MEEVGKFLAGFFFLNFRQEYKEGKTGVALYSQRNQSTRPCLGVFGSFSDSVKLFLCFGNCSLNLSFAVVCKSKIHIYVHIAFVSFFASYPS